MQKLRTDLGQVTDGARGEERLMREVRVTLPSAVLATRLNNKYRYERQVLPLLGNERGQTWSSARRPMRARFADATVNVAHDSSIVSVFEGSPPAWLIVKERLPKASRTPNGLVASTVKHQLSLVADSALCPVALAN